MVESIHQEQDGDLHILIALDSPFRYLLTPGNVLVGGRLVVEPVCELPASTTDAQLSCAADHDRLDVAGIAPGQHLWLEGRDVTDSGHSGWAELHPLYRWGLSP